MFAIVVGEEFVDDRSVLIDPRPKVFASEAAIRSPGLGDFLDAPIERPSATS